MVAGLRRCALLSSREAEGHAQRTSQRGLVAQSLRQSSPGRVQNTVVGTANDVEVFQQAWQSRDDGAIGALLGYPGCCRAAFVAFWRSGGKDPTWPMAGATDGVARSGAVLTVAGSDNANILWRWLGIRAVAHLPCSFSCEHSAQIGERMFDLGYETGYAEEMEALCEVLAWPVEYSALHGIAEIKTPLLRIATQTDATAQKYVVKRPGTKYPAECPPGVRFPYRAPVPLTLRRRHADTLRQTATGDDPALTVPEWDSKDNGFASQEAMNRAHRPLTELASRIIGDQQSSILDLGSGNGALLAAVSARCSAVTPFGVDLNPEAVAHAALRRTGEVRLGDFFDSSTWRHRHYSLAILMFGRLLEREEDAGRFLRALRRRCDTLLAYIYTDWSHVSLDDLARQHGLIIDSQLRVRTDHVQAGIIPLAAGRGLPVDSRESSREG